MTATQLRLLGIFGVKLVANAVEELYVALLRVLLHGGNKGPRHCASSL